MSHRFWWHVWVNSKSSWWRLEYIWFGKILSFPHQAGSAEGYSGPAGLIPELRDMRDKLHRIAFISSSPAQEMNIKCHNRFSQSVSPTGSNSGRADWMFREACLVQRLFCLIRNTMTFVLSAMCWHQSQSFSHGRDKTDIEAFQLNFLRPLWRHELFMFWHLPVDRIEIFISY